MNFLPALIVSLALVCQDRTKTYDISWLMMEIPAFRNAPNFDLIAGMSGQLPVGNSTRQDNTPLRQQAREKIEQLLTDIIGEEEKVTWSIWQKTLVVRYR